MFNDMKSKFFLFSILLTTCFFASCGLIKRGDADDLANKSYKLTISAGEGGSVNSDVNGSYKAGTEVKIIAEANSGYTFNSWSDGNTNSSRTITMTQDCTLIASFTNSSSQTETKYYIKHPWGNGLEASWAWKQMNKIGSTYEYTGLWGGTGANINTKASDSGAEWFAASDISGASSLSIGDGVQFIYNPATGTLSATKTSGGGGSSIAKVRINCLSEWSKISWGLMDDETGKSVLEVDFSGKTGMSSYQNIDVSAGHTYSLYWTDGSTTSLVGGTGSGVYHEKLVKGHKYTYTVSGSDESRTDDGTF